MACTPFNHGLGGFKSIANTPDRESDRENVSVNALEPELSSLFKRYEQYVQYDAEKAKFVSVRDPNAPSQWWRTDSDTLQEVLTRYEYLSQQYQTLSAERTRDQEFLAAWQTEKHQYEKWFKTMQRAMADNPFVMVLIDGDGMIVSCAWMSSIYFRLSNAPVHRRFPSQR
jgi:hypothetical protein